MPFITHTCYRSQNVLHVQLVKRNPFSSRHVRDNLINYSLVSTDEVGFFYKVFSYDNFAIKGGKIQLFKIADLHQTKGCTSFYLVTKYCFFVKIIIYLMHMASLHGCA